MEPRSHVARQLRDQARSCAEMGSPLYAHLLVKAATDVEASGPCWEVLSRHVAPGRGDAVALRFLAAVHRLVLSGRAPGLARRYPSAGGRPDERVWQEFRGLVEAEPDALRALTARPCQTNEVGRAAPLMFGFLAVAAEWGLPLRVLELGASAGLNLRFDHFRYGLDTVNWGDPKSPVDLTGLWREAPPDLAASLVVAARRGCDRNALDPSDHESRLTLRSSVWADQTERLARLEGALELAARIPAVVDAVAISDWLPEQLASTHRGLATVVYHSVVVEYLPEEAQRDLAATLAAAGSRATPEAPLGWLRLEPISGERHHGVTLTTWPGGRERLLAFSGAHGADVATPGPLGSFGGSLLC
ncbi:MAG TPA: DUF2332 domain-containing protein [Vicinamibacteria bacterium]|nr:DUF2332 domain-containing protein [Vicinamibacteria bacterium]